MHKQYINTLNSTVRGIHTEALERGSGHAAFQRTPFSANYMVRINETACNPGYDVVHEKDDEFIVLRTITYSEGNIPAKKEALRMARAEVIKLEKKFKKNSANYAAKKKAARVRTQRKAA